MHDFQIACMQKEENRILHARLLESVHVKMENENSACTTFKLLACKKRKIGFCMHGDPKGGNKKKFKTEILLEMI